MTAPVVRLSAFTATLLFMLVGLGFAPNVAAQASGVEDFERCDVFDIPDSGDCATDLYTYSSSGTGSVQVVSTPAEGSRASRIDGTSAAAPLIVSFDTDSTTYICDNAGGNYAADFRIYLNALPAAGERFSFGITNGGAGTFDNHVANGFAYFIVHDSGVLDVVAKRVSGTQVSTTFSAVTMAAGSFYHFQIECTTTAVVVFRDMDALESTQLTATGGTGWGNIGIYRFYIGQESTGGTTGRIFVDEIQFSEPPAAGQRFCADPGLDDLTSDADPSDEIFGWDYLEGASFDDDLSTTDLGDGFVFVGDTGDTEYAAKGFATGSQAFDTWGRIESTPASISGEGSVFRFAYTTGATALTAGAAQDDAGQADRLAASDGADGGNFDNHVQAWFEEVGDDWRITIRSNTGGAGLEVLGGSRFYGDPDKPTTFRFLVNSGATAIDDLDAYSAEVWDENGEMILSAELPAGLQGVTWKDQWFMGSGSSALDEAVTILDDVQDDGNDGQGDHSTCIYDLLGTSVVTGSDGASTEDDNQGTLAAPTGVSALVTTAMVSAPGTFVVDLRWRLSTDDPDQDVGEFTYGIYVNGVRVGADSVTTLDVGGIRYNSVSIQELQDAEPYTFAIRAEDDPERSPLSCQVQVDPEELGDLGTCGDITGLVPADTGVGTGGGLDGASTTGTDIGVGINGFFHQICGTSTAALFFCGLVLLIVEMASVAAVVASLGGKGIGAGLAASIIAVPGGLGNVFLELWGPWVGVTMIVLAAGIIAAVVKKQFAGGGVSAPG